MLRSARSGGSAGVTPALIAPLLHQRSIEMSRLQQKNSLVTNPREAPGDRDPSARMARDRSADHDDPYETYLHYPDGTVCVRCGAEYIGQRWVAASAESSLRVAAGAATDATCPACRKAHDRLPQGILTLHGGYWIQHRTDIMNLLRNEEEAVQQDNPLARIIGMREEEGAFVVETTTEKLAQRLGRRLERAHKGEVDYKFGPDRHLARVNWTRE